MYGPKTAKQAFVGLFPGIDPEKYRFSISFSGRFSRFNGNIRKQGNKIAFSLSKEWKDVSEEITTGLLQELLLKLFGRKAETENMRLYQIFIKKAYIAAPKEHANPDLAISFERVNDKFFAGMVEEPNLRFGRPASSTMGSYNYHSDTITINPNLKGRDELIDYVMHHEILHKKLKFTSKNGRTTHHTREFRQREKTYPESQRIEKDLAKIAKKAKMKKLYYW